MEKITDVTVRPCEKSRFVKPLTIDYFQNDEKKSWDLISEHDEMVYKRNGMQSKFMIAVYIECATISTNDNGTKWVDTEKYPGSMGLCLELCAGLLDKNRSAQEIAQMELMEECGYQVPLNLIERVTSFRSGVGTSGSQQTLFYAEVTDTMRVGKGGGLVEEGEMIEVIHMPVEEGRKLILDDSVNRPSGMLFALQWFFATKWQK